MRIEPCVNIGLCMIFPYLSDFLSIMVGTVYVLQSPVSYGASVIGMYCYGAA